MAHDYINVKKLTARINEVKEELAHLLHIEQLLGVSTKTRRGFKPKASKSATPKVKKTRKTKAKGDSLKSKILAYLAPGPQPIKSIVTATKGNYGSVAQTLNGLKKAKLVTKAKERGGAYSLVK